MVGCGYWTDGVAAEKAITEAGYKAVDAFAQGSRNVSESFAGEFPWVFEECKGLGDSIGAMVGVLAGSKGVCD